MWGIMSYTVAWKGQTDLGGTICYLSRCLEKKKYWWHYFYVFLGWNCACCIEKLHLFTVAASTKTKHLNLMFSNLNFPHCNTLVFSVSQLQRNILASNPRVTRFHINWEGVADKIEDGENVDPSPNVGDMFSPSCIPAKLGGIFAGRLMPENSMDCMWEPCFWTVRYQLQQKHWKLPWYNIHKWFVESFQIPISSFFHTPLHNWHRLVFLHLCLGWAFRIKQTGPPSLMHTYAHHFITLNRLGIYYFLVICLLVYKNNAFRLVGWFTYIVNSIFPALILSLR